MKDKLSIGQVARATDLSVQTIRFYENEGVIPPLARTESGYRSFSPADVRRLRLASKARVLGLGLSEVKTLLNRAFTSECAEFADQLLDVVSEQKAEIDRRIEELQSLRSDLDALESHVRHSKQELQAGQSVARCEFCPIID